MLSLAEKAFFSAFEECLSKFRKVIKKGHGFVVCCHLVEC